MVQKNIFFILLIERIVKPTFHVRELSKRFSGNYMLRPVAVLCAPVMTLAEFILQFMYIDECVYLFRMEAYLGPFVSIVLQNN